jgi:hypothetical protein
MLSMIDLLIKVAGFIAISKAADLNLSVQGGQLYWFFPFSKDSLVEEMADWQNDLPSIFFSVN